MQVQRILHASAVVKLCGFKFSLEPNYVVLNFVLFIQILLML